MNTIPATPIIIQKNDTLFSSSVLNNQWYNQTGNIQLAVNAYYIPASTDDYYVIVTANGCSSLKSNSIHFEITGIVDQVENESILIYPNPATQFIQIKGSLNDANISIFNVMGQNVINKNIKNSESVLIDIGNLKQGLYFITIYQEGKFLTRKIIKKY